MKFNRRRRRLFKFFLPRKWFVVGICLVLVGLLGVLWNEFFLAHSKVQPKAGGIYTEATLGETINLNPLSPLSSSFDRDLQQLLFAGLLRYDPLTEKIVAGLAEMQVLEQGQLYQLKIREDAKFSNGDTVDVADVLFTFETLIKNPGFRNESLRASFEYVEISVVDERTVSFRVPEKNVFFPYLLTTPILPQKSFGSVLLEEVLDPDLPYNRRPIGAGPYAINNIVPENDGLVRVFLQSNPHYYLGEPHIREMVIYVYANSERLQLSHVWPTLFSRVPYRDVDNFQETLFGEYTDKAFYQPRFAGLFFNLDEPIASNVNFRKALKQSVDLDKILEDGWEPVDSPFFFENIDGVWPGADVDGANITLRDNGFPYNRQLEVRTFERQGPPARIKLLTTTQPAVYSRMAQSLKNTWESELDIEVDLLVLPPEKLQVALRDRLYDVILFGQDFSRNLDNLSVWHSSQTGKLNLSNITRDDVDFLIEEIRFSGAPSDYAALQDRLDTLVPMIALATPNQKLLFSPTLKGFEANWGKIRHLSDRFSSIHAWHFYEKLDWDWPEDKNKVIGFVQWLFSGKDKTVEVVEDLPVIEEENPVAEEPSSETTEEGPVESEDSLEVSSEDEA